MENTETETAGESDALSSQLLEIISSGWRAQVAYVMAELGLADLLNAGPRSVEDLAAATDTHAPSLLRLLRAAVALGLCAEREAGSFEMTPLGALLASDTPGSLRSWARWWGTSLWPVWGNLLYSVTTGQSARKLLLGSEGFSHLDRDPQAAAIFNRAMSELAKLNAAQLVRACAISGREKVVDIGGGTGGLLTAILQAHPSTTGILFDRPQCMGQARDGLEKAGLLGRCELVAGDFFESVPSGADVYILKSVFHDWDTPACARILAQCRGAMGSRGRLLILEQALPDRMLTTPEHRAIACGDLTMLVAHAAGERTESELRAMLVAGGMRVTRVEPAGSTFTLIEAVADSSEPSESTNRG